MKRLILVALVLAMSGPVVPLLATTIYVDDNAPNDPGPGDPSLSDPLEDGSAEHPFDAIQEGIDAAVAGDTVLVKDGTYTGTGNRDIDFLGKAITVRSENGPEMCVINCEQAGRGFYFHSAETAASVLDGFTVTKGHAGTDGGGIYCANFSRPTITHCTIRGNSTHGHGGGMAFSANSDATVRNCTISDGTATQDGGGIYCYSSRPTITNCTIGGNSAGNYGGGIGCGQNSKPKITNCTISDNSAAYWSGGIDCDFGSQPTITNCVIRNNRAIQMQGGGVSCIYSNPTITNCTITGNSAGAYGGGMDCYSSSPTITSCVFRGDSPNEIQDWSGTVALTYCDVEGGTGQPWFDPATCIDADPLFVSGPLHDYYLSQMVAGQAVDSPCVDAGSDMAANLGLDGLTTRQDGGRDEGMVDMGYHAPPAPYVHAITRSGDDITVWWNGLAEMSYVVEWSGDHVVWNEVALGAVESWTDVGALTGARRCYRVREDAGSPAPGMATGKETPASATGEASAGEVGEPKQRNTRRPGNVTTGTGNVHAR